MACDAGSDSRNADASPEARPKNESTEMKSPTKPPHDAPEPAPKAESRTELHPTLARYVGDVLEGLDDIAPERRKQLKKLALFIETKRASGEPAKLTFICTHNSRRSHLSQLWAAVAAAYHGIDGVHTFSGGTEATAFNPRAVAALERAGFEIETAPGTEGDNPHYRVSFAKDQPELEAFSKKYMDAPNPTEDFAAIMTCSEADKNCPVVQGAVLRVPLPYVDPKEADDTPEEAATYDARARQIAAEMFYLFSQVSA